MARKKTDSRIYLTRTRREQLFDKCKGRCCHCGCELTLGDNFSIEHIIPLSKGGTNDFSNTVALCKDCNWEKGDDIVDVEFYIEAPKLVREEIRQILDEYYENHDWLTVRNVFKHDRYTIQTIQSIRLNTGKLYTKPATCELRKIDEEEYEEILGSIEKRNVKEQEIKDGQIEKLSTEGQPFKLIFKGKTVAALHCGLDTTSKTVFRIALTIPANVNLSISSRIIFIDCIFRLIDLFSESVMAKESKSVCLVYIDAAIDDKKAVKVINDLVDIWHTGVSKVSDAETNKLIYLRAVSVLSFGVEVEKGENGEISLEDAIKKSKLYSGQLRRRVNSNE